TRAVPKPIDCGRTSHAWNRLRENMNPEDLICTSSYSGWNRICYYAMQAGIATDRVRCPSPPQGKAGHVVLAATVTPEHLLQPADAKRPRWYVHIGSGISPPTEIEGTKVFRSAASYC